MKVDTADVSASYPKIDFHLNLSNLETNIKTSKKTKLINFYLQPHENCLYQKQARDPLLYISTSNHTEVLLFFPKIELLPDFLCQNLRSCQIFVPYNLII